MVDRTLVPVIWTGQSLLATLPPRDLVAYITRMMKVHNLFLAVCTALGLLASGVPMASAQTACQYILGFKTLHDLVPATIGNCLDNQAFAANGDAQQDTTNGLLAWRKADNWTAFTDGYRTWINGPDGIQQRLNTQRYSWEADAGAPGLTTIGGAAASSPSSASTTSCHNQVSAPSTFDPATRTFTYGPNGLAIIVPVDWCVRSSVSNVYVEAFPDKQESTSAVLQGPQLGEQITLTVFDRPSDDGYNKAAAYFAGGASSPSVVTFGGLTGWATGGTNGPSASCVHPSTDVPVNCLPNQWGSLAYLPWRPGPDTSHQLAVGQYAPAGTRAVIQAVTVTAKFVL